MKVKKINTIPNGNIIVLILSINVLMMWIIGILLFPKPESIALLLSSLIFVLAIIDYISNNHLNYVYFSSEKIWNKNEKLKWNNVFITMKDSRPKFSRNSYEYYIYFSDHYLTMEEIKLKKVKRNGLYLVLTKKRAEYLFSFYKKKVRILSESPLSKNILEIVKNHNILISNSLNE